MAELLFKYGLIDKLPQSISREKLQESLEATEAVFSNLSDSKTDKLASVGIQLPEIRTAVEDCILKLKNEN
jgi:hypothetical protein